MPVLKDERVLDDKKKTKKKRFLTISAGTSASHKLNDIALHFRVFF